ncbi:hypothetical protein MAR_024649 [Mya arenaria]|uniref:Uncharacterized protein n=1 Tax=Mya arenaria TaxID=6604 RepID=A0ABY7DRE1_MYAAR|nr:uncharacterized protein LOC128226940 [Mya arenaria]XP_052793020.1 uncharacterized protein LOC128226940 [Mya arenaria]WAR00277.1 hypothetical protein MAR_024649 [Mya arenaria]
MRDLREYSKIVELMEEYKPKPKPSGQRTSVRYKPIKDRVTLPKSPSVKEFSEAVSTDILRQTTSKALTVNMSSLEFYRNELTKKVKMLDVKLSFSYQEDFSTQTVRLEKQLVRHGNRWVWENEDRSKNVISFPYQPGDRVNLNIGVFVHKTKKHGLFGKETITTQVGTATEVIVLARDNGVGMGLHFNEPYTQNMKLNFDINGRGHKLTLKFKLDVVHEDKGHPMLWLRPKTSNKRFRSLDTAYNLLLDLPPKDKDEDGRVRLFVYNNQRLVNYHKTAVLECLSVRPVSIQTDIPTGIELRTSLGGKRLAFLVPVVKIIDTEMYRYRLAILVVTAEGPHCLCSAKWKTSDKFDYKIYMFKTGDTFGQRIRWSSKDFLDISYAILNSTGHQIVMRQDSDALIEDVCIGLSLKMLVRWSTETLPWKQRDRVPMMECQKYLSAKCSNSGNKISDFSGKDIISHMKSLPQFLESQELMMYTDVEEFLAEDETDAGTLNNGSDIEIDLVRAPSQMSCESIRKTKRRSKRRGELNIEDPDDLEDDIDTNTQSSRYRYEIGSGDDLTTSGFIDDRSEYTGGGSWVDSVL